MGELLLARQRAGILPVVAVDDVGQRRHAPPVRHPDRQQALAIDHGRLFACVKIGARRGRGGRGHAENDAAAGPAAIEAEHEAGLLRRSAMVIGKNAQRAVTAAQQRRMTLDEIESGSPHQRPVAEHPEIVLRAGSLLRRRGGG
ncbi:MAG: hypothetical protein BGP06_20860 [Rhizobiales bacterium 65-9]|nr:MAG: hypothetical protein BGP06_20860 [Rhizobiales bacterium 65-9]